MTATNLKTDRQRWLNRRGGGTTFAEQAGGLNFSATPSGFRDGLFGGTSLQNHKVTS